MTVIKDAIFSTPVLRVNNRQLNIDFYIKNLGLKLVSEENAIAIFTSYGNGKERFVIEESPSVRTRAVQGPKKVNTIVVKTQSPKAIESLLANGAEVDTLFKGENGYAYETLSPEGDRFLLHSEDDISVLEVIDTKEFQAQDDFKGLPDFTFEMVVLNVLDPHSSCEFYQTLFGDQSPVGLEFMQEEGPDLAIEPNLAWDLEILEFTVSHETDLAAAKVDFEAKGFDVYLDKKEKILVVSDPSRIEVWFMK
ncbi:CppA N-terminal domain-containing protein [Streptococcus iniae]|uniref:Peptidase n=1 Tax=Streptococcus iniae TaxID=1346 RepID=A0A3L8GF73_STRIN|nr:CppA N-terminal domain-containing protein [Streptococcus iniae]AGM99589.1 CppA family protein [Streptococcus iniae SF1]AHY16506.1 peptidase [Streptococcus iniae]AHY18370.1 peptidase [Streptococcus iniae]AJG26654.1 peptidase [Streptococcus iniae]APD32529.1 peptidase [Streptococcus iniae]